MDPDPRTSSRPSRSEAPGALRIVALDAAGGPVDAASLDDLAVLAADPGVRFWLDAQRPDAAALERISAILDLHPLVTEDVSERNERPKIVALDGALHLVLFALAFEGEVVESEIDFILADRWLLTVHDGMWDPRTAPLLRRSVPAVLGQGTDFLLYGIVDAMVDGYFPVLDRLTEEIDDIQDSVVIRTSPWELERLFVLKRELIRLRRSTAPAREILNQLTNRDLGVIKPQHVIYFRDVYDHLIRVADDIDNYRELVAGTLDVYLTAVNNNLSEIMKRLTGVTVILAGIGAIAGIFGMSEAGLAFAGGEAIGFWIVAVGIVCLAVVAAFVLRRIRWI